MRSCLDRGSGGGGGSVPFLSCDARGDCSCGDGLFTVHFINLHPLEILQKATISNRQSDRMTEESASIHERQRHAAAGNVRWECEF